MRILLDAGGFRGGSAAGGLWEEGLAGGRKIVAAVVKLDRASDCEFQNGTIPGLGMVTALALVVILWGLG